jgi:hypothetical protein
MVSRCALILYVQLPLNLVVSKQYLPMQQHLVTNQTACAFNFEAADIRS